MLVESDRALPALIRRTPRPRPSRGRGRRRPVPSAWSAARRRAPAFDVVLADPPYAVDDREVSDRAGPLVGAGLARARRRGRRRALAPRRRLGWPTGSRVREQRYGETMLFGRSRRAGRPDAAPTRDAEESRDAPSRLSRFFDPVTNGHVDIIRRAARLFDELVVGVLVNPSKAGCSPSTSALTCCARPSPNSTTSQVEAFQGLLVDFCRDHDIDAIVKGLRAVSDFDTSCRWPR